ncbi:hypothetical protein ELH26_36850 [Rhizobium leguminosarum]|uniref:hypothetical protein n=1 Tax=Rhizobium leguminosarum TaxID=384 RepID=UPI0010323394|nr:hypothetical protein [Rhizobium leguminosarum]TBC81234.1 hypothetical protein ELH26_36850 [Rhizobium leguminosarum]
MTDKKKDAIDNFIDFIISDDTPLGPEDHAGVQMVRDALDQAERKLAKSRLERARAGAFVGNRSGNVRRLDTSRARALYERAKAGDPTVGITLAARFGDGSMDGDVDAILEDIAELDAEDEDNGKD